jgi:hypothetical protein
MDKESLVDHRNSRFAYFSTFGHHTGFLVGPKPHARIRAGVSSNRRSYCDNTQPKNIMKLKISIFLFCCMYSLSFSQAPKETVSFSRLKGTWINTQYLDFLKLKHSPYFAVTSIESSIPYLDINKSGFQWLYSFHSGDGFGVQQFRPSNEPNTYLFTPLGSDDKSIPHKFIVNFGKLDTLVWIRPNNDGFSYKTPLTFIKSNKSLEYWVNKLVIAGKYKDSLGNSYVFTESGRAIWPKESFNYEIGLDCEFSASDRILRKGSPGYVFRFNKNSLLLYRCLPTEGEQIDFEKEPFIKLFFVK